MYLITEYVANSRIKLSKRFLKSHYLVLDAGCGNMNILKKLKRKVKSIIGVDLKAPCNVMSNLNKLGFKDNTFDAITCFEVVEHCNCWDELFRVLKPGGILIVSTPAPNTDWIRRILLKTNLLENQDFEHHDHIVDLRKLNYKPCLYKKMFLNTSQFGIFKKVKRIDKK